jgi:hypothetical protein
LIPTDATRFRPGGESVWPVNGHQKLTHLGHEELTHPGATGGFLASERVRNFKKHRPADLLDETITFAKCKDTLAEFDVWLQKALATELARKAEADAADQADADPKDPWP